MKELDLSIIIVNYNAKEFLQGCLRSIFDAVSDTHTYEVIVVDNDSPDDSADMVRKSFPQVHLIASKENLGFSKGNNKGVDISKGRYVLFLNPDTIVYKGVLEYMVEFMDTHKDAGASTCYLKLEDGTLDDAAHRGFPTPWNSFCHFSGLAKAMPRSRLFAGYSMGWTDMKKVHEIDALAGAFMLTRRIAGEQAGWWDEDYFFYGEDLDFCYTLKEKGWKIYFVPDVSILHYKGVSGGIKKHSQNLTTATQETKIRSTHARFQAMKVFYEKHYVKKYPKFINALVMKGIALKQKEALKQI